MDIQEDEVGLPGLQKAHRFEPAVKNAQQPEKGKPLQVTPNAFLRQGLVFYDDTVNSHGW
jgi:hypothetical protein